MKNPHAPLPDYLLNRRRLLLGAAGAATLAALTACGAKPGAPAGSSAGPSADQGGGSGGPAQMVPVEGDFGTVQVPSRPQRVVAGYDTDTDVALVLGLPLVGASGARGSATLPFPEYQPADKLQGVSRVATFLPEPNLEAIAALKPDLILDGAFGTEERYAKLQKIAPTLSYNKAMTKDWRQGLTLTAKAFGREAEAQKFIDEYAAKAAALKPRVEQKFLKRDAVAFYPGEPGEIVVDPGQVVLSMLDCGFTRSKLIPDNPDDAGSYTPETLGEIRQDADLIMLLVDVKFENGETTFVRVPEQFDVIKKAFTWKQLPAVQLNRVYYPPTEYGFISPLTAMATLDFVEKTVLA
jgi:iron complex transport system substrate-binding protein